MHQPQLRNKLFSSTGIILGLLVPEDEGTMILQNIITAGPTKPVWEPKIFYELSSFIKVENFSS